MDLHTLLVLGQASLRPLENNLARMPLVTGVTWPAVGPQSNIQSSRKLIARRDQWIIQDGQGGTGWTRQN